VSQSSLPAPCRDCAARSRSLCGRLAPPDLEALSAVSRRRTYRPGQLVAMEGQPDPIGTIVSGLLAGKKTMADGREQIVALLFAADFHGNPLTERAGTTTHALTSARLCLFDRPHFERLLETSPDLRRAFLAHTLSALTDAQEWMLLLGQKTAGERVASFLLRLAERRAASGCRHRPAPLEDGVIVEIPLTRAQMAACLGLTIETVSRRLSSLRDSGLIDFQTSRTVRLVRIDQLRATADARSGA